MENKTMTETLNAESVEMRIYTVMELKKRLDTGSMAVSGGEGYTNNHVHTKYSFSPYSPAGAVWSAYTSGLSTVGIIDHDTVNGAQEFIEAGSILGIATTIGFEMRTDWSATKLNGKRLNNPDQVSNAYICAHGLPHTQIKKADAYLSNIRLARGERNRAMTAKLNEIMKRFGLSIDYDKDVLPISYAACGGEVTDRHILYALALNMTGKLNRGRPLIGFITGELGIPLSDKQRGYLEDTENGAYEYDLLNILKGSFVPRIYIDAGTDETPPVSGAVKFIKKLGAIPTYCYLGDVKASPTGDKKEQKFEDDYLEDVLRECKAIGFDAIAFMPSRNTGEQLDRVMELCDEYGFLQISGEDINQPRQSFICRQLKDEKFAHLGDAAWALVGHEKSATEDLKKVMFADGAKLTPDMIRERVRKYKAIGKKAER